MKIKTPSNLSIRVCSIVHYVDLVHNIIRHIFTRLAGLSVVVVKEMNLISPTGGVPHLIMLLA